MGENLNETSWLNELTPHVSGDTHFIDIIIGAALAIIIPIMYSRIQRSIKKMRLVTFWSIFKKEIDFFKDAPITSPDAHLRSVLLKMKKIEFLVAEILTENQFHEYLDRIEHFDQLMNNISIEPKSKVDDLIRWLGNLISTHKLPKYLMWATAKVWCRGTPS